MLSWLLPKEIKFFDYFNTVAALTKEAAQEIQSGPDVLRIKEIEHQADDNVYHCIEMLRTTFITPIDRNDIYNLISRMDDIIDAIYAAARSYAVYKITTPTAGYHQLCRIILESVQELEIAVKNLDDLKKISLINQSCANVTRLDSDSEHLLAHLMGELFEKEVDLRELIKWKEIYEHLGKAINRCKATAHLIEGIILEHS